MTREHIKFEKWQSLGNSYLLIDQNEGSPYLSSEIIKQICSYQDGVGADGVVAISSTTNRGYSAQLRIFNPDGSEAELSGNGVRQACSYLHRSGRVTANTFSVETKGGEVRATVLDDRLCRLDIGRASLTSENFVSESSDGQGQIQINGSHNLRFSFQHVTIGNPQCSIRISDNETLSDLPVSEIGSIIENHHLFPNRTNISFWTEVESGVIRARIFERGVGETLSSGTGACGAAITYVLQGGDSPVTVLLDGGELQVDVDESLHVMLTGPSEFMFRGEIIV